MIIKLVIILFLLSVPSYFILSYQKSSAVIKPLTVKSQNLAAPSTNTNSEFIASTPTIDQIFSEDHSWITTLPADRKRVLIATGDVIPARVVNIQTTKLKDFKWPYEKTASILRNADVTFINLETPLIKDCPLVNDGFKFCGSDKNIEGLLFAGIDIASLANNHSGNYGLDGINQTIKLLEDNNIQVTGGNGAIFKDIKGLKFAFLGYNDIGFRQTGISWADEARIQSEIAGARESADVVIVTYHWGAEYRNQPDARQKYLGRFTIDAGADLVIGNHPHWIQPVEIYRGKLITYAHGNFIFDQEWSLKTKQGVVGKYTFYDDQLVDVEFLPVFIENFGQASFIEDLNEKRRITTEMFNESDKLNEETKITRK